MKFAMARNVFPHHVSSSLKIPRLELISPDFFLERWTQIPLPRPDVVKTRAALTTA